MMMVKADYDRVVDGLERCFKYETATSSGLICEECPYNKENGLGTCSALLLKEALELIKEQEPKRMWLYNGELCCPQCGAICKSYYHYCNECGQAVKWSE